jgi:AraC-like DNA-binding protein
MKEDGLFRLDTCELLSSGLTQKQVAFKLGYTDVQSFSRQFRRFMNIAPGKYLEETQHQRQ